MMTRSLWHEMVARRDSAAHEEAERRAPDDERPTYDEWKRTDDERRENDEQRHERFMRY
jgi:hypothetical protein